PTPRTDNAPVLVPHLQHKQVLIIEDNLTHGDLLARQLTDVGMIAHLCTTGDEALDFLQNYVVPDLVLLDVNQPKMDELAVATLIHRQPNLATLPIVALTPIGYSSPILATNDPENNELENNNPENDGSEDSKARSNDPEITAILSKPIKYHQLIQVIEEAIAPTPPLPHSPTPSLPHSPTPPLPHSPTHPLPHAHAPVPLNHTLGHSYPLRILVAEDNRVNQRLQEQLLQRLGYEATVVGNGVEVTEAMERQSYDLVLMDLHMPKMDGLMATQWIRQTLPQDQQPRIIAVTASAMAADRQRCLRAGMDDYISKPIQVEQLTHVLQQSYRILKVQPTLVGTPDLTPLLPSSPDPAPVPQLLSETVNSEMIRPDTTRPDTTRPDTISPETIRPKTTDLETIRSETIRSETIHTETIHSEATADSLETSDLPVTTPPMTAHEPEGLDWGILKQAAELVNHDHGFMAELMVVFLAESQTLIDQMQEAIATQEFDAAYRAVHTLKSSSASLGAMRLASLCKQFERHVKTAPGSDLSATSVPTLLAMYDQIKQEYTNVAQDIDRYQQTAQIP
ncbi:MAG: response regulator, partial [Leptolyngbyaceae cyanobacterium]